MLAGRRQNLNRELSAGSSIVPGDAAGDQSRRRRILLIDDHPITRQGLLHIVAPEADLVVCAEAGNSMAGRAVLRECRPDLIVSDIGGRQEEAIHFVREVRALHPSLPILILSSQDEFIFAERLLSVGANGYIMKHATGEAILFAMRRVLEGGIYVSEALGSNLILKLAKNGYSISGNPVERLSARELQILRMLGKGMTARQTANALSLSVKTVESHRQRVKRKLNLETGAQLIQFTANWLSGEAVAVTPLSENP